MDNISDKSIEIFISAVQERPHLYDKKDKLFKDNIAKENGWRSVGLTINITGTEAQEQFGKLRQRYRQEQKRVRENTVSGSGSYKDTNWPFFDIMGFIDSHIQRRKTKTNYTNKETIATTSNTMDSITIEIEEQLTEPDIFNLSETISPINVLSEVEGCCSDNQVKITTDPVEMGSSCSLLSPSCIQSEASSLRKQQKNKNKQDQVYVSLNNTLEKFGSFMETRNVETRNASSEEELETGKIIAKELSKVKGKKKRLELKAAIFSLISNYISDDDE